MRCAHHDIRPKRGNNVSQKSDLRMCSAAYPICCARRAMPRYIVAATNKNHLPQYEVPPYPQLECTKDAACCALDTLELASSALNVVRTRSRENSAEIPEPLKSLRPSHLKNGGGARAPPTDPTQNPLHANRSSMRAPLFRNTSVWKVTSERLPEHFQVQLQT